MTQQELAVNLASFARQWSAQYQLTNGVVHPAKVAHLLELFLLEKADELIGLKGAIEAQRKTLSNLRPEVRGEGENPLSMYVLAENDALSAEWPWSGTP